MPAITVKNIPDELYAMLKKSAQLHHRSINSEIIACIENTLRSHRRSAEEILAAAVSLRDKSSQYRLTDIELNDAKRSGRP